MLARLQENVYPKDLKFQYCGQVIPQNSFGHTSDAASLLNVSLKWHMFIFYVLFDEVYERSMGPHLKITPLYTPIM